MGCHCTPIMKSSIPLSQGLAAAPSFLPSVIKNPIHQCHISQDPGKQTSSVAQEGDSRSWGALDHCSVKPGPHPGQLLSFLAACG